MDNLIQSFKDYITKKQMNFKNMKSQSLKWLLLLTLNIFSTYAFTQTITPKANLIKVKNVSFLQVCTVLLDSGYVIEKKDIELQTIKTEMREYQNYFNAAYYLQIRIKDSVAFIRAYFTGPWWDPFTKQANKTDPLWKNELAFYETNNKGKPKNSLYGYPFLKMIGLAKALSTNIEYIKE